MPSCDFRFPVVNDFLFLFRWLSLPLLSDLNIGRACHDQRSLNTSQTDRTNLSFWNPSFSTWSLFSHSIVFCQFWCIHRSLSAKFDHLHLLFCWFRSRSRKNVQLWQNDHKSWWILIEQIYCQRHKLLMKWLGTYQMPNLMLSRNRNDSWRLINLRTNKKLKEYSLFFRFQDHLLLCG